MSLFSVNATKKQIITYQGYIGPKKNPYMALEKRLSELVNRKELGFVSDSNKRGYIKSIFRHFKSGVYLLYESSPSPYGRNEDLSIFFNSKKSSPKDLEKCEQWLQKELKDLFD